MSGQISVIVPVYNVAKYLDECVKSILDQTYKDLEVLLIDDGSDDGSEQICNLWAEKDSRIKVFHSIRGGVSAARNIGLNSCNGDFIAFVDSDDFFELNAFSKMMALFTDEIDVVCCSYKRKIGDKNELASTDLESNLLLRGNDAFLEFMKQKWYTTSVWNKIFRRKAISDPWILFRTGKTVGEDELWLHEVIVLRDLNVFFFNEALYNWRMRKGSALHSEEICGISNQKKDELSTKYEVLSYYDEQHYQEAYLIAAQRLYECVFSINLDAAARKDKTAIVPEDRYYVIGRNNWFNQHKDLRSRLARVKNEVKIKILFWIR